MTDEFARIAEMRRRLSRDAAGVRVGIGDDAAVLDASDAQQVVSVDAAVEGVHFRCDFLTWADLGYRSLVAALSDLAAMGARPRASLLSLILPERVDDASLYELADGVAEAARKYGAPVIGGNLSAGGEVSITTTVIGECREKTLGREGARPGDGIFVTGGVGRAALGLRTLQAGSPERGAQFVDRWRRPAARIEEGLALRDIASAAIDISDGLYQDLEHLCESSRTGAQIDVDDLPLDEEYRAMAGAVGSDPLQLALAGGEDYELLFTADDGAPVGKLGVRIGRVTDHAGHIDLRDGEGRAVTLDRTGYRHFRGR
jgi:thiamine-monophosphate kinase